ncbi:inosine/xanthosine triphosphatase [Patescibacteria group bacterium]|nr:inosine/xanthosine triphosphatase [Patescibacteria group bacterium]
MRVAVGSKNPVKIKATTKAFKKAFGKNIEVFSVEINSLVSAQPLTDSETFKGALHRAKRAKKKIKADFGVGIEGGVHKHKHGIFSNAWVVVIDKIGNVGSGTSARFQLPNRVIKLMSGGKELGEVIDNLVGGEGIKKKGGAYGVLTEGKLTRSQAYEQGVLCALMPFLTPDHWR